MLQSEDSRDVAREKKRKDKGALLNTVGCVEDP